MIKRIISAFLIILVFMFNCCPVYALDSFSSDNFININASWGNNTNIINSLINDYKFVYYAQYELYWGLPAVVIGSNSPLDVVIRSDNYGYIDITNNNSDDVLFYLVFDDKEYIRETLKSGAVYSYSYGGGGHYNYCGLLIYNKDCVSQDFCSADVYVEFKDTDDYEEDGVVIKGLTAFFNKMTSALNDILETVKGIVDSIIGIPEEGYFVSKIDTIKESINAKYNLDSLFGFFEDMKNINSTAPDFRFDKDLKINGYTFPFDFYIDFSWFDGEIKNIIFLLFRAVGYPLLILYNLNQVYLLFRGRKFINEDGGEDA